MAATPYGDIKVSVLVHSPVFSNLNGVLIDVLEYEADLPPETGSSEPGGTPANCPPSQTTGPGDAPGLVKVSVPEARRLACLATAPISRAARDLGYSWSRWRRRHQAPARWHHYHAGLEASAGKPRP
jgi:hypothetical protein